MISAIGLALLVVIPTYADPGGGLHHPLAAIALLALAATLVPVALRGRQR
jgi:hypothetical protein